MRGRAFREGFHDFTIQHGGVAVFPRLVAAEHHVAYPREPIHSGVAELDKLLGGGLTRGTSTLLLGPSGSGKTSIATQFATYSAQAGKPVAMFLFEEGMHTFEERSRGLGMDITPHINRGNLTLRQVDPAELSPGEFTDAVRREVEGGAEMVVIDSLNGYMNAMPNEKFLMLHLHELLTYLGQHGVTTILLMTQHGILSGDVQVPIDASYLADTVMLVRYFEAFGEVRQAVSAIKKRTGAHEHTIRELRLDGGLKVGEPVRGLQGVLTGNPQVLLTVEGKA
jgi:circadian clock protein KaiC